MLVINRATFIAGQSAGDSLDDQILTKGQMQHELHWAPHPAQAGIQFLRLGNIPGESVKNKTSPTVRRAHLVGHRIDDNIIGDQLAGVQNSSDLLTDFSLLRNRFAKEVPRRDLGYPIGLCHQFGLGPFS